ncbi:MAG TPA: hypothetical protein VMD79_08620 [Solirubrobacteraceae bacterium]|nr:hypothetical protein [Solirubrobacteraceae bacterium]
MTKRNVPRRGRSRKRRPSPQAAPAQAAPHAAGAGHAPPARASQRQVGVFSDLKAAGERPPPPWHPLPLSELLIFVGLIGAIVAWIRGYQSNAALLGAGIGAVILGTVEVSLREHLSGFRPHTAMLAVIPPIVFHSLVVLALAALIRAPRWLNYALLPIDLALLVLAYKLLRARYTSARRQRTARIAR